MPLAIPVVCREGKITLQIAISALGVMKNFVMAMDREGNVFVFLQMFLQISIEKLKAGIFDSPQIRDLIKDLMFDEALSKAELLTWLSLKSVVTNFLGNHLSVEYKKKIEELLNSFCQFGA